MADREYMRKLLDEVLGADRNRLPDERGGSFGVKFTDAAVCKHFLVGFCPYMQFQNTKSDIGDCPHRFHEESIRDRFLAEGEQYYREGWERDFLHLLEKLVSDLERRIRRGQERLNIRPEDPTAALNPANDEFEEKRTILDFHIKELLGKIEAAGEEGRIQEAQELMAEVEKYRGELERLRVQEAENPSYRLEKKMEICPTCGAFLVVGDVQKRIEAHFEGRQHNGWARIREMLAELKTKYSQRSQAKFQSPPLSTSPPQREPGEIEDDLPPPTRRRSHDRDDRSDRRRDRSRERDYGRRDNRRDYHGHYSNRSPTRRY